jgi:hypothetical protein
MGRDELYRNVYNKIWKAGLVPNGDVSNLRVAWETCKATWDSGNLTLYSLRITSTCLYLSRFEQSKYLKIRHVITWASRFVPKDRNAWPEAWSHQSPNIYVGRQHKFKNSSFAIHVNIFNFLQQMQALVTQRLWLLFQRIITNKLL